MTFTTVRHARFAGVFFIVFLLCGCATYPAFQDPDIDYNGRWGPWDGGMGSYDNPFIGWVWDDPSMYNSYPEYYEEYYGNKSVDEF